MSSLKFPHRKIRSFVVRDGRMTEAQRAAIESLWPSVGLSIENGTLNFAEVFQRRAKTVLEIGFGSGYSLFEMAKTHPEHNIIGIEMHQPGIGSLLQGIQREGLTNIRIYHADAVEVLEKCIAAESLDTIQLFFPDPWPKRKHHKRRLIQSAFVELLVSKLITNGALHLATDWPPYAEHMMAVLSANEKLINVAGAGKFADRSTHRPVVTKFEQRGTLSGRPIAELRFIKCC